MPIKRLKYSFSLFLILLIAVYSFGLNTINWMNDPAMLHLHLVTYSEANPVQGEKEPFHEAGHDDHHASEKQDSHSHAHRHSEDSPIHEHSHPDTPVLQLVNYVLPHPIVNSLSDLSSTSEFLRTASDQMISNPLLHSIFRPPISRA